MPSLSELGEFKDSFGDIANEREDLISRDLHYESLNLPGTEASPVTVSRAALLASDNYEDENLPLEGAQEETDSGAGAFDFSAFLGSLPEEVNPPSIDEPPSVDDAFAGLDETPSVDDAFAGLDETPSVDDAFAGLDETPSVEEPQSSPESESLDVFADIDFTETSEGEAQSDDLGLPADTDLSAAIGADTDAATGTDISDDLGLPADTDLSAAIGADTDADAGVATGADLSDDLGLPADTDLSAAIGADTDAATGTDISDDLGLPADMDLSAATGATDADDFSVPDGLLSGLSEEIESSPVDFPSEESVAEESSGDAAGGEDGLNLDGLFDSGASGSDSSGDVAEGEDSLNFDDLGLADLGEDTSSAEPQPSPDEDFDEALDLGGERRDGSFSTESAGDENIDFGTEALASQAVGEDAGGEAAFSDVAFGDAAFGEDAPSADIDFGGDSAPSADDGFSLDDLNLGGGSDDSATGESADNDFDLGEESIDLGGEEGGIDLGGEDAGGNLRLDDVQSDIDLSGGSALSDFDIGDAEPDAQDSVDLDIDNLNVEVNDTGALPDFGDLGGDFSSDSIDLGMGSEDSSADTQAAEPLGPIDFDLPGLEDIFEKTKIDTMIPPPKPKKGFFSRRKKPEPTDLPEPEDVEEIKLSQDDLDKLLATLAAYPLNLRVACEELIAEQVLEPQQLSKLLRYLIYGISAKEMAEFAGQLLKKTIIIPRSFEKSSGAALEAEKASFAYIFIHNFLPIVRLFAVIAALAASTAFLIYKFVYTPIKAESLYKRGYERIFAGEYTRANELFHEAFVTHRKKKWFYEYARGFRDERRYMLAEAKYDELLRYYPRDKRGVLEYAHLETYYLLNYDKANQILQRELLDYAPNDYDGLLASGDNFLAWADSNPEEFYDKYDDARFAYARLLELYGWKGPLVERMMRYFIRTDNLKEVLPLREWFDGTKGRKLSSESLAELGGYLLDKQIALAKGEIKGVPDPYIESIESVRAMLLQAVRENPELPEPHYHLARYYNIHGNSYEERLTLENAVRAFDLAKTETVRRRKYRVDTHYRYANLLINLKEFFPAEEQVVRGIELYEDFLSRNLLPSSQQLGQLYAVRGDLEYFVKAVRTGDDQYVQSALNYYRRAEQHKWSPPEIQYRMGSAYYQLEDWKNALDYLFKASSSLPLNRRLLFALGNTAYRRGNYYAAQGYYDRLLNILENQRVRLPVLLPNDGPEFLELGERLMMARNNAGVVYEALAEQTGRRDYRSKALTLYAESARAWDSITRNPNSMERMRIINLPGAPSVNPGFSNANNALRPVSSYEPQIFPRIDKDVLEPSKWEEIAPYGGLQN